MFGLKKVLFYLLSGILITNLGLFGSVSDNMTFKNGRVSIIFVLMFHFSKMSQVGAVTAICVTCFLIRCVVVSILFSLTGLVGIKEGWMIIPLVCQKVDI